MRKKEYSKSDSRPVCFPEQTIFHGECHHRKRSPTATGGSFTFCVLEAVELILEKVVDDAGEAALRSGIFCDDHGVVETIVIGKGIGIKSETGKEEGKEEVDAFRGLHRGGRNLVGKLRKGVIFPTENAEIKIEITE